MENAEEFYSDCDNFYSLKKEIVKQSKRLNLEYDCYIDQNSRCLITIDNDTAVYYSYDFDSNQYDKSIENDDLSTIVESVENQIDIKCHALEFDYVCDIEIDAIVFLIALIVLVNKN